MINSSILLPLVETTLCGRDDLTALNNIVASTSLFHQLLSALVPTTLQQLLLFVNIEQLFVEQYSSKLSIQQVLLNLDKHILQALFCSERCIKFLVSTLRRSRRLACLPDHMISSVPRSSMKQSPSFIEEAAQETWKRIL